MQGWLRTFGAGLIALGLLVLGLGAPLAAAQPAANQARAYLDAGAARHVERGYQRERSIPDEVRGLRMDSPYLWPVQLRAGVNYRIFAACDNDCQDIDMELYGADGRMIDRDIAIDDTPYVQVTPAAAGTYYVRVWVFDCSSEPCFVAMRTMSGGRPGEREEPVVVANDYETTVRAELDAAGVRHTRAGFTQFGEDLLTPVMLASDGHREVLSLEAGRSYVFQGACDQDCNDVDMEILDGRGDQLDVDIAVDDRPVVELTPAASGDYIVRVWLAQCTVEPCYVGLRSYVRGQ